MRKALLVIAGLGLVALAFPTVHADGPAEDRADFPSGNGTHCASVDRDTTDSDPNANVEHPDGTDDPMRFHVEAVVTHEDQGGERVAVGVDVGSCLPA